MAEKLHTVPIIGVWINSFSIGKIRDDHGNAITYRNLDCASGEKFSFPGPIDDSFSKIIGTAMALDFKIDGQIELPEGQPSPLQTYCAAPGKFNLQRRR